MTHTHRNRRARDRASRRPGPFWALVSAVLLLASACEFIELPDGGYRLIPDAEKVNGERVLIIGDSLMRQPSLSVAFGTMNAGVETLVQAVNTSGLVSGPTQWNQRAAELIVSFKPTIVIIGFIGNFSEPYWPGYSPPGAPGTAAYNDWIEAQKSSDEFVQRYLDAGDALAGVFELAGVTVYWVEPPPLPPQYGSPSVSDRLWASWKVDLPAAHANVKLLSARASVANADGTWKRFKSICGNTYEIRSYLWDGGVHFTADGAGTYGRGLARALSAAEGWPAPPAQCPGWPD